MRAERRTDSARLDTDPIYYEITEESDADVEYDEDGARGGRSTTLEYVPTKCAKRDVVHVMCSGLECGIRPRLHAPTRAR